MVCRSLEKPYSRKWHDLSPFYRDSINIVPSVFVLFICLLYPLGMEALELATWNSTKLISRVTSDHALSSELAVDPLSWENLLLAGSPLFLYIFHNNDYCCHCLWLDCSWMSECIPSARTYHCPLLRVVQTAEYICDSIVVPPRYFGRTFKPLRTKSFVSILLNRRKHVLYCTVASATFIGCDQSQS